MDERCFSLAEEYCQKQYVHCGKENLQSLNRVCRSILAQRRCPEEGLSDLMIEHILTQISLMDANNFKGHLGGGEREGRVISSLVRRRHYGLAHGIGRSGNLTDAQPKAAGSTLLYNLTNTLILDFLRLSGAPSFQAALCVPMATGMTISLVLRTIAKSRVRRVSELECLVPSSEGQYSDYTSMKPKIEGPEISLPTPLISEGTKDCCHCESKKLPYCRFVIWPRIDQKTALKCIESAGFEAIPVPLRQAPFIPCHSKASFQEQRTCTDGIHIDSHRSTCPNVDGNCLSTSPSSNSSCHPIFLQVHVEDIASAVELAGGPASVLCILSTTSCFAPRLPDDVVAISRYAQENDIPYVINNAYGTQSQSLMKRIEKAQRDYRVDYVIQSGDKNFLVPVGGAVVASSRAELIQRVGQVYAGRASASPIVDLFITSLHLGRSGMKQLWEKRQEVWEYMLLRVKKFAQTRKESLVEEWCNCCAECPFPKGGDGSSSSCTHTFPFRNNISLAVTMYRFGLNGEDELGSPLVADSARGSAPSTPLADSKNYEIRMSACKEFGAKLFRSRVTGPRVIIPAPDALTTVAGKYRFRSYGCHQDFPVCPLLVMACGIGMAKKEVDGIIAILEKLWPSLPDTKKN